MHSNSSTLLDSVNGNLIYLLDVCVSYFTYLAIFTAHNGSREALAFLELPHRLYHRFHHNYLITAEK